MLSFVGTPPVVPFRFPYEVENVFRIQSGRLGKIALGHTLAQKACKGKTILS